MFQGLEGRTGDYRDVIAWEVVLDEQLAHFEFDELKQLLVIDHVLLVEEHHQGGNTHLLGQKDVLLGLGHGAVGGGNHKDAAVHLGGAGDHVLHVVRVTGAVHVGVVTAFGLVFNVGSVDGDPPFFLLRGTIDFVVSLGFCLANRREHVGDRCRQRGLAMVNVTDRADVDVRFVPLKLLAGHC